MKNIDNAKTAWVASPTSLNTESMKAKAKPLSVWMESRRLGLSLGLQSFDKNYMPFSLFEDCNVGNVQRRQEAFDRNKEKKDVILPFMAAWALRGTAMGAGLSTAARIQTMGVNTTWLQAGFGVALALCVVFCIVLWIGWLGLTFFRE